LVETGGKHYTKTSNGVAPRIAFKGELAILINV
jgi:hypothetical protein